MASVIATFTVLFYLKESVEKLCYFPPEVFLVAKAFTNESAASSADGVSSCKVMA